MRKGRLTSDCTQRVDRTFRSLKLDRKGGGSLGSADDRGLETEDLSQDSGSGFAQGKAGLWGGQGAAGQT
jgi:hypothetical protein